MSDPAANEAWLRRVLRLAAAGVFLVTPVELVLAEHTGAGAQWIPFFACGLGLSGLAVVTWARQGGLQKIGVLLLGLTALAGLLGLWEHIEHNYAFVREIRPNATAVEAIMQALFGASPLLAPGIFVLGALLAWASAHEASS